MKSLLCISLLIFCTASHAQTADTTASYSLKLKGIEVTAQRRTTGSTTAYVIDRATLDHAQMVNLTGITSLLPGGKTVNATLMDDSRLALRSGTQEMGNAAFGTAIEVGGMRLDNNAMMDETLSASTRNISSANIGSVEVITGIASVEYGDVSNGIVRINPRHGLSPWIVEGAINPYTRQIALSKGIRHFNFSFEHANSFSNTASPHTAYQRNNIYIGYGNAFQFADESTLRLRAAVTGNVGGYNSEADPDAFTGTYSKVRDNQLRINGEAEWRKRNIALTICASFSTTDKRTENYVNTSSSSTQAYIHTMTDGYRIAQDYDLRSSDDIILSPTGYWYVRSYNDQKPQSFSIKGKMEWQTGAWGKLLVGVEYGTSRNNGRGLYYEDLRYAPTWRPYDYSTLPSLRNLAMFVEERLAYRGLQLTAGLRSDVTMISRSAYGNVASFSPRLKAKYRFSDMLEGYIGWGKSVKLPSFQVLYPADAYTDKLTFTPGSTADNRAYYAYYTHVSKALRNGNLRWQYTNQVDIGMDFRHKGIKASLSAYWHRTKNPYQMVNLYTPFSYHFTSQSALENIGIPSNERTYNVDPLTGIVTVNGTVPLAYTTQNTYVTNRQYVNGSPVTRYGLEWMIDLPLVSDRHLVGMTLRLDGNYYHYKGLDHTLIAGSPNGVGDYSADSEVMPLIGYYAGSNVTSASTVSTPSISNGALSKGCNLNATLTARIPRARLIMTLKVESTLLNYRRQLSEGRSAVLLAAQGDVSGTSYNGETDGYVALYPEYYSTWENPAERIPFAQALETAQQNDQALYTQLCRLIVRSNTSYYFNPNRLSSYFSCNFSITKEIGDHVSLSFYANNFLNNMQMLHSSQTGLESSIFNSGYIPKFYYGASLRLKL